MKWFFGMVLATSLIAIPAIANAQSMDITADVQKLANDWMNAYNKKDAATIAQMYTDDGTFSTAAWTASGRTAIADALNKEFAAGIKMNFITVDQAQRIGDISYSRGTWAADMKGPDGKDMPVNGHWLIVAKCQGQNCLAMVHNSNIRTPKHSTDSLRIAATTICLGLRRPRDFNRVTSATIAGLYRMADRAGMYSAARRTALPILEIRVARSTDVPD